MRTAKVWGGCIQAGIGRKYEGSGSQLRVIVKAATKKRALEILEEQGVRTSAAHFNRYWCETGNAEELFAASALDEGAWYAGLNDHNQNFRWLRKPSPAKK